ncbi:MAG: Bax inhibitor-1/YccA family protein [Limnohabitans sp.]|nr:Bax inhibitor-1/YccA family protein [Limnohabitans sp.]
MSALSSSNPVLSDSALDRLMAQSGGATRSNTASVQGVMAKTGFCTLLAIAAGAGGYWYVSQHPGILMGVMLASFVISLVGFSAIMWKPALAMIVAPLYSITQGVVLGALSMFLDSALEARGIKVPGGLALQAFVITGSLMATMLALHTFGIIRAGPRFASVLSLMTLGLMVSMLIAWVLTLFGIPMPFLNLGEAFNGGQAAWIGLGLNVGILLLASLWLLVDLAQIDDAVASGAPKSMEWLLAFGLMVTLAWVYLEALKLAFRIAAMFGERK